MSIFDALDDPDWLIDVQTWEPLSESDVEDIRAAYASGAIRQVDLADQYGVSQPYISRIVNRKRRKGVE